MGNPQRLFRKRLTRKQQMERDDILAKHTEIENKTEALVLPIIEENGFELVDVEYVKEGANWYLRVYADKEGGINIDDCVLISRALEAKLDAEDFIEDAYILEVSSPGLGRPLKKEKDYLRSIGKSIDIKLYQADRKSTRLNSSHTMQSRMPSSA